MKELLSKIQDSLSLILSIIAVGGLLASQVSKRVGEKKDIEYLQLEQAELEVKVDGMEKTQVEAGKEDAKVQEFMKQHMILHENLH